jgi:prohibitin 1
MSKFKLGAIITGIVFLVLIVYVFVGLTRIGVGSIGIVKHMDGKVTEVPQGFHWTGWGVSVQEYPTYTQALKNKAWQVGTGDQQELPVDTNLTWKISTKDVGALYQSVGGKDIDYVSSNIVSPTMKNVVNKITHKYNWGAIKGSEQADITEEINKELGAQLLKYGIEVGTFGFTHVGSPAGMAQSQQQLATSELKVKQAQADQERAKIENQTRILTSEANAKAKLIEAQGQAKANDVISKSLNPQVIEYAKVQKWNGVSPTTVAGEGASALVGVK